MRRVLLVLTTMGCAGAPAEMPGMPDAGNSGAAPPSVYVAPAPLGHESGAGTQADPITTISAGIDLATTLGTGARVLVAEGVYNESVTLRSGISIYGGYNAAGGWTEVAPTTSIIHGGETAVLAQGLLGETHVEGFTILSADAQSGPGASSYGVRIVDCTGTLVLQKNLIVAGGGATGASGGDGARGPDGAPGANGAPGC